MSKHLEALTQKCNERFTQISTPALQSDFESKLMELNSKLDDSDRTNQEERQKLMDRMQKLETDIDTMLKQSREDNRRKDQECKAIMKELVPSPEIGDYIKQFEKDERLAEDEANGITYKGLDGEHSDEPTNDLGIILNEKEWHKKKPDQ